ncbi:MAG: hypothetical protein BGO49_29765 [Planctomycetales bacterium 71-10]|nr:MAG: hypothetical protein BGO49_29765 [Planctomycetales bacterium 71-10]
MRRNVFLAIAALVLVAVFATLLPAQGPQASVPTAWEYRVILITEVVNLQQKPEEMTAALEAKFNELGKEGWDIAENINGGIVFKRRKR